ncbi:bacterial surface protein 26-residue repeat [Legionella beliardensis]|uniref:Bacterial surface protein 26-residue repeat n=1 Tax=Legionella beliardensis TaxID=91822 RepID=A0A378HYD6_9GAMM|nr:leucine-rich repeat domain-containing protein [Legionella beliardensis]STX27908.1 bacterial surface protein 26-residue repeat [Legionella beliardensis]
MQLSADGKTLLNVDENDIIDGSYQIPAGITTIGAGAFSHCSSLQTITIPVGVTTIGAGAFSHCSSLQAITIPAGVTTIDNGTFAKCSSLQTIVFPAGITAIGARAFSECRSLQRITLPAEVTTIGIGAFRGCRSLQRITIPAGVTTIANTAFINCTNLQTLILPAGIEITGYSVFPGCDKLTSIIIDNDNQAELEQMTASLSKQFKSKVILKSLFDEVIRLQDKQLARILFSPQTNQIYRFFHFDTRYVSMVNIEDEKKQMLEKTCTTLSEEIFCHINIQGADANRYYQKAKVLVGREPWPKTHEELRCYEARLIKIVTKCIKQAEDIQAAIEEIPIASPTAPA